MSPGATPQLLMTTMGPGRLQSMASVGSSLWEHLSVQHPIPQSTIAEARQAEQPVLLPARIPLSQLVAPRLVQEQISVGQITGTFHVSFNDLSNDVDNISLSHSKA